MNRGEDYMRNSMSGGMGGINKMPAFQLNKFQSEFNLSFNKEMAKLIAYALQKNEDLLQNNGKNVPSCLYALLSKLEDMQKPRRMSGDYDDSQEEYEGSYRE